MTDFYFIPEYGRLEESERFAKEQGLRFEYNDFILPDVLDEEDEIKRRIESYKASGRDTSKDTMHGAFFDVTVFSYDAKIREVSFNRMCQSMEIAKELGLRAVVFHGNYLPFLKGERYDSNWLSKTEAAVRRLAEEFPGIGIYMENMFDDTPEMLVRLATCLQDVPTFGICLDYSHALILSKEGEEWFRQLAPWIRHIHVNDHCFVKDVHLVPGEGQTDWTEFFRLKETYAPEATIHCEVSGLDAAIRGISFLKEKEMTWKK